MTWKSTVTAIALIFSLTPNTSLASSQSHKEVTVSDWLVLVKAYSLAYKMDPNLMAALARAESEKGNQPYRFGFHGGYWQPFGIHKKSKSPRKDEPGGNTEAGIKAFAQHMKKAKGNVRKALSFYNTGDKGEKFIRYCKKIEGLWSKNKKEGIFDKI